MKELLKSVDKNEVLKKLKSKSVSDKWTNIELSDDLNWIRKKGLGNKQMPTNVTKEDIEHSDECIDLEKE